MLTGAVFAGLRSNPAILPFHHSIFHDAYLTGTFAPPESYVVAPNQSRTCALTRETDL